MLLKPMSASCIRITRKEQKIARTRANRLMCDLRRKLKGTYKMTFRIVGSGCWGTMVKDSEGKYDLDYQIIITRNSKDYESSVIKNPRRSRIPSVRPSIPSVTKVTPSRIPPLPSPSSTGVNQYPIPSTSSSSPR